MRNECEDDRPATWAAEDKYGTESGTSKNTGATEYVAIAFDTPSSEKSFTIIPGCLTVSWSWNITFVVP